MNSILKIAWPFAMVCMVSWSHASITNPCTHQTNNNARNNCEALYQLNALFCEKVTNLDSKLSCILKIKDKQRLLANQEEDHYQRR